ncbi:MAG: Lsr2 family protein [Rhodococcus sp. (in: high G+C Gram-positive bacteria)]|nr:Lsr2 family protein [Rhodococcus sp. (in: high G+C Gram-positive bacteria)]
MVEIFVRQLIDDLDGNPVDIGLGQQVNFSYQGTDYRIDLRPSNADKIDAAFAPYVKAGQRDSSTEKERTNTSAATKSSASGRSAEQLKAIRDWAGKNGFDVAPRGRIKADVLDAFDAAH